MSSYNKYPNIMICLSEENGQPNSNKFFISWMELILHTFIEGLKSPLWKRLSTKRRFPMFPKTLNICLSKTWGWVPIFFCPNKIFRSPLQSRRNSYTVWILMMQSLRRDPMPNSFFVIRREDPYFSIFGWSSPTSTTWYSMKH